MTKKRAFSYIRLSTEEQLKGHSLQRQLELAREYAKKNDLELVVSLQDIGVSAHSGANIGRGKLGRFLKAIEDGEIEKDCVLLVENLDRLSRQSPRKAFKQFSDILDYGIEIHTIFDRQIYTSESVDRNSGQLFSSIGYMLRAYSESEDKSIRLKEAWKKKRENIDSKILTTVCPSWLQAKSDKSGFEVIPDRVQTIEKIFDLCIDENMGAYSIARWLNEHSDEYPHFGKAFKSNRLPNGKSRYGWQKSYIRKILNNPAVYGVFQPLKKSNSGIVQQNYFPVVIAKDRFLLAKSKIHDRAIKGGGRKGESFNNVFTKLLVCGRCGGAVHFRDRGKPPKGGKYLRCYNAEYKHQCSCPAWRYDDFEDSFYQYVTEVPLENILAKGSAKTQLDKMRDELGVIDEKLKRLDINENELLKIESALSEDAMKSVVHKIEEVTLERKNLESSKKEIEIKIIDLESAVSPNLQKEIIDKIKEQQEKASNEEKAIIRRKINKKIGDIVQQIVIHNSTPVAYCFDAYDHLSRGSIDVLEKLGIKGREEVEVLFYKEDATRLFNKMERYFTIKFKSGDVKTVYPFQRWSWTRPYSKQNALYFENAKKRKAEKMQKNAEEK